MIRLALPLIGRGAWTGGYAYLKNTLRLIRSRLTDNIEASVFLSPAENERFGAELAPLAEGRIIVDPVIAESGRGKSLLRALATGRDGPLEAVLRRHGIDATFEVASFYGRHFGLPVISWLPDLQHRHMPEMFGRANWWRRDLGFRMQIASGRTLMVSSRTALADLERFYPAARGRGHVVRFAIDLDIPAYTGRGPEVRATYRLPERFFYLPNQIWRHKNHAVIVAALAQLKAQDKLVQLPPVILTGLNKDPRNPQHFDTLMRSAAEAGIESHFRYLGLVPYDHVLSLAACCDALINPSFFEGWSTPIEEAKAFAAPLLLSDIAIHREQAPDANFFAPGSVDAATRALLAAAERARARRPENGVLVAAQVQRLDKHARALLETVSAAVNLKQAVLNPN